MAQGKTPEEALHELDQARFEYILSLLEDGLPVPGPLDRKVGTGMTTSGTQGTSWRVDKTVVVSQEPERPFEKSFEPLSPALPPQAGEGRRAG
jgi:hypothetical protein